MPTNAVAVALRQLQDPVVPVRRQRRNAQHHFRSGLAESVRFGGNAFQEISRRADLRIAAELGVRNQPDIVIGDSVGNCDQIIVTLSDEPREDGDSDGRTGRGK